MQDAPLFWLATGIGCFGLWFDKEIQSKKAFMAGLVVFSFLSTSPGLYFRPHYFILVLPAVSLLVACGMHTVCQLACNFRWLKKIQLAVLGFLFTATLACSIFFQREYLFKTNALEVSKQMYAPYQISIFPEIVEVANFIRSHSSGKTSVVVIGSEPEIYFYLKKRAPTGYIYFYYLTEGHPYAKKMQQEFMREVEIASPDYLVFGPSVEKVFGSIDNNKKIFDWYENYRKLNYNLVGTVEIDPGEKSKYSWDKNTISMHIPLFGISVFERKTHHQPISEIAIQTPI